MREPTMTNIWHESFRAEPYPTYARLRGQAPVHQATGPMGSEFWLISRYTEARAALNDPRLAKHPSHAPAWLHNFGVGAADSPTPVGLNMLSSDPPDHTRLRRLTMKAFTPKRVERLRPRIQQITDELIANLAGLTRFDLIEDLAFPLPIIVICELLGIPGEDRDDFRTWTRALIPPSTPEGLASLRTAQTEMTEYLTRLVARKRDEIDHTSDLDNLPDLVSALIVARDEYDRLSEDELLGTIRILLTAGHHTTVNLIGNAMLALLRHPDQLELLRARPDLLPGAIEELLRYDGPFEHATPRFATEDIEIAGVTIPAGSVVAVVLSAANRDPAYLPGPDRLDVTRTNHSHLAFGHGIHFCLGAPLARLEGQIAIGTLLRALPEMTLACPPEDLRWWAGGITPVFRGLEALPIRVGPFKR
ncbi:cytochrome P450 [Nonomuraea mesophila]|uniref:Cytochrome P450 n=2 Tax=Nonomuraea mesophila TaxID=2530382 RepID=A0A4R5F7B9_9ACTN|nr:cytochrome P450 [Nonomuraea mesophila]